MSEQNLVNNGLRALELRGGSGLGLPPAAKAAVLRGDYGATISRTLPVLADCLIRLFRTIPVLADGLVLAVFEGSCTWLNSFLRTLLHRIQYAGSLLE